MISAVGNNSQACLGHVWDNIWGNGQQSSVLHASVTVFFKLKAGGTEDPDVCFIQLTCLTTDLEPLCLAVEMGRKARRRRARRRMLKSCAACSFLLGPDIPAARFLWLEVTSFSHSKLRSIQTISLVFLFWK